MPWFDGFEARLHAAGEVELCARTGGNPDGPPLLLLHGYPQTHAMWHRVARLLAPHFALVIPDLRGYGDSTKPAPARAAAGPSQGGSAPPQGAGSAAAVGAPATPEADHAQHSKRAMAADMAALMSGLGHRRFSVVGHDRGGRVAHRLALDFPERVAKLAVIDIVPTLDMYERTDMRFASYYYHWFFLIQPPPLPERLIGADPSFYLRWTLGGWGGPEPPRALHSPPPEGDSAALGAARRAARPGFIEPEALAEYERCFARADAIHAACEDYRASATIDLVHDRASRAAGERVACDMLVLWGERGVVALLYDALLLWRAQCAGVVSGEAMPAGHFIPEELPDETAARLLGFLRAA